MRDVDDLLTTLDEQPLPPAPGAAAARARGDALRRRGRVLAATAAIAAVALVGFSAAALTRRGEEQRLQPTAPTANPTPSASSAPLTAAEAAALLLTPEDIGRTLGGTWISMSGSSRLPTGFPAECPGSDPLPAFYAAHGGPDGQQVAQDLAEYADDAAAEDAVRRSSAVIESCPGWIVDGAGDGGFYRSGGRHGDVSFLIVRVGRLVSTAGVRGARLSRMTTLSEVVASKLLASRAAPDGPISDGWPTGTAYLTPAEASAAEAAGFEDKGFEEDPKPLLDPCGRGEEQLAGVEDAALANFGSEREAGGSSLVQWVVRFEDDATARRAAQAYLDSVDRCPVVGDNPMGPESETRYTVVKRVGDLDRGVFAALVRRVPCRAEGGCAEHFATYAMVVRSRDGVLVANYSISEDGDPRDDAERLLDAMAAKLAGVTG